MNFLLDMGSNVGQGLNKLNEKLNALGNPNWEVYSFEANPHINISLSFDNYTFINKAIYTKETEIEFTIASRISKLTAKGIYLEQNKGDLSAVGSFLHIEDNLVSFDDRQVKVQKVKTINAIGFLQDLIKDDPCCRIYIKMDIEGAEFLVCRELVKHTKITNNIVEMWVETHERNFEKENHSTAVALLDSLRACGVLVHGDIHFA